MIPDRIFKSLEHVYKDYKKYLNGQELEKGYKPDYVLKKKNQFVILESENNSSRKMYVGGMIKAAHFLKDEKSGILIYVIKHRNNTKPISIANHLRKYFEWIKDKTNLQEIYVIDTETYLTDDKVLPLDCEDFNLNSFKV